ncbi:hypothetical protein AB6A40_006038 [Gnathostoma spinigerum]|uniref:Uncharacterized protein n=1 Tax=Gnathostoma spinigerum TaxID=75299 RepID=A0ABD6EME9_9BILA
MGHAMKAVKYLQEQDAVLEENYISLRKKCRKSQRIPHPSKSSTGMELKLLCAQYECAISKLILNGLTSDNIEAIHMTDPLITNVSSTISSE